LADTPVSKALLSNGRGLTVGSAGLRCIEVGGVRPTYEWPENESFNKEGHRHKRKLPVLEDESFAKVSG
jgi:hypothetical protein